MIKASVRRSAAASGYLARGLLTAGPALLAIGPALVATVLLLVALPWLPWLVRPLRALANVERRRAARLLGREIPAPYDDAEVPGVEQGYRVLRSAALWRDLVWLVVHGVTGVQAGVLAIGLWPSTVYTASLPAWWWAAPPGSQSAFVPIFTWSQALVMPALQIALNLLILLWLVPRLARWQALLAEVLLRPTRRSTLAARVERLAETRAGALEAHGAELRRIERDLHDGTQAQLVAAALRLGLADRRFDTDPGAARTLFLDAREGIEEALTQLRTVIRGIYPPILSDRGLAGALHALAAGNPIPIDLDLTEERAPAAVEAAAYFVAAEALTNIAKHSGAGHASLTVRRAGSLLRIVVRDDGKGGADPGRGGGSGLAGIRRRVAALDGTTRIDSPDGGGTTLEVDLPCGS